MTSSDVLDTCLTVQLVRAADILHRRRRQAAGGAEAPRLRAQGHRHHRPQPRHPRRADDLRHQARPGLCRVRARARAPGCERARRSPPARSRARSAPSPTSTRASRSMSRGKLGLQPEPVSTQVIPRDRHAMYLCDARRRRLVDRAAGDRDPPPAAHRSAGGGGVFLAGPEGLVGHAAQAQPGADREPDRPCPHGALLRACPAMENVALWHERDISHSSVERMIGPGRDRDPRFRAGPAGRRDRQAASSIPRT